MDEIPAYGRLLGLEFPLERLDDLVGGRLRRAVRDPPAALVVSDAAHAGRQRGQEREARREEALGEVLLVRVAEGGGAGEER